MTDNLERGFHQAMLSRYESWKAYGYRANRFLMALRNRGGLGAAKYLLAKDGISPGLVRLAKEGATHLSVEALVLSEPWDQLFTDGEKAKARRVLGEVRGKSEMRTLEQI